ncbi:MAG: hypothetical protein WHU94_03680 [Thermogemmata sp.]|jgi:hypothetical protein|uniref:Intracellular proteinase inhibitor BsuPI domain-containing protein n=1 Tax=Thermogemmata fonticola TaxID=2755323 RepID=A0A7V8VFA4_9BACT|nr:hypothetical protein [Thermogemmata fonticola]MBA2226855.1 hypothetical protein [Thermogemmata fonticola]
MNGTFLFAILLSCHFHSQDASPMQQKKKESALECRFIVAERKIRIGEVPNAAVELKNTGKEDIRITSNTHPFEHLDIEVRSPDGEKISDSETKYGGIFSPSTPKPMQTLTLRPGESYRFTVCLFAMTPEEKRKKAGDYRIKAVFDDGNIRSISPEITMTLVAQ